MSNKELMCAEFEACAQSMKYDMARGYTQRYAYENTQSAWMLWQAATVSKQRDIDALNQQVLELSAQVNDLREALTAQRDLDYTLRGEVTGPQLERKLAERKRAITTTYNQWCGRDLMHLELPEAVGMAISKAREEGRKEAVPDGWQVVPKVCTAEMAEPWGHWHDLAMQTAYEQMLAAAPSPASLNAKEGVE